MLLDELMPRYDVAERHRTIVRAAPETVYAALRTAELAGGPVTAALLALRALPAAALAIARSPGGALAELRARRAGRARRRARLRDLERQGFRIVAERAPEELVLGIRGRFWTPRGGICGEVSAETFGVGPDVDEALAGWSFTVRPLGDGTCELATETRVWCGIAARRKFRAYWLVVRPGSGLIRRAMLRAIRREAERARGEAGDAKGPGRAA